MIHNNKNFKYLVEPPLLAKFTQEISSNRMWIGGLWRLINPFSRGYRRPAAALYEHDIAGVPEWLEKKN